MPGMRFITDDEVRRVLGFKDLLAGVERALSAFSRRSEGSTEVVQPVRSRMHLPDSDGNLLLMPGCLQSENSLVTKVVTMFPNNPQKGISFIHALVLLMNPETGVMEAMLDGEAITELRTAASSGVASMYLAPEEVKKVAIIGAGVQAASHARVHQYLFAPKEISIWSRTESNTRRLVEVLRQEGIKAVAASTVEEATKDADVINTCTTSTTPVLWFSQVKEGAHINVVGANTSKEQEIDPKLMTSSVVYTDTIEAAKVESGDVILSKAEVYAEIGDVINKVKEARRNELTVYKSLGMAVLDAVSARLVVDLLEKEAMA